MRPLAKDVTRSVVCVSVCWSHGCAHDWTDRDSVWGLTDVGPKNHVLHGLKIRQILSQFGDAAFCHITLDTYFSKGLPEVLRPK